MYKYINNFLSKVKNDSSFIKFLILLSLLFPYFLFYILDYDFDISVKLNHIIFIISFYILQLNLMKILPGNNIYVEYTDNVNKYINIKNNGKYCTLFSFLLFVIGYAFNYISPLFIINNIRELIIVKLIMCLIYSTYIYYRNHSLKIIKWINFFYGSETFPIVLSINSKILNYQRFGMTIWLIYIYSFILAKYSLYKITYSLLTSTLLQIAYIFKFFKLEGEYNSSYITMTKNGWMISYINLVYIPLVNTLPSHYYYINDYDIYPAYVYASIFILGLYVIFIKYKLEMDKKIFKDTKGELIYNNIRAHYLVSGNQRLLMSGLWGKVRKPNYLIQIIISFLICSMHGTNSIIPYIYCIMITLTIIFKISIEEERYLNKYQNLYKRYMELVKYKLIPYIF